ncbi:MAG: hypothetical protein HYZ53_12280 [Planctomycetes bacterium]|nr:hypothetical protein [Planctomycetota bacterium]
MDPNKKAVGAEPYRRLLRDLVALPPEPVGECLTDDEFAAHATGVADVPVDRERMRAHLAACAECRREAERLTCAARAWRDGNRGVDPKVASQPPVRRAAAPAPVHNLHAPTPPVWRPAPAAVGQARILRISDRLLRQDAAGERDPRRLGTWKSGDERLTLVVQRESSGRLRSYLTSADRELAGHSFRVSIGDGPGIVVCLELTSEGVEAEAEHPPPKGDEGGDDYRIEVVPAEGEERQTGDRSGS